MLRRHSNLTAERAKFLFNYDPQTGDLTWRNPTSRAIAVGAQAGTLAANGNRYVSADGEVYLAHRVAWLMTYGSLPQANIAAKNGNYDDLRIENFEERSFAETARNRKGAKGVSFQRNTGRWVAEIRRDYQRIPLGTYDTKEEAQVAYAAAAEIEYTALDQTERARLQEGSRKYQLLQRLWGRVKRDHETVGWGSFADFSRDVGPTAVPYHRVVAHRQDELVGPLNFTIERIAKFDRRTPEARVQYYRERNIAHRERYRNHHLKGTFGITVEQYGEMHKAQNGLCAICNEPETAMRKGEVINLAVDHCHTTGAVRGLLCRDCNHTLGKMKEDSAALRRAADYLDHHAAKQNSVPASNVVHLKQKER